jgi:hypothetical protein
LEEAMDIFENGKTSLKKAIKHWNIFFTLLFDHLYEKTKSRKLGSIGVLIVEED